MAGSIDYSQISIESLNCDKCSLIEVGSCSGNNNCVWVPDNKGSTGGGSCMDKCTARTTKGECEQYHEWNRSRFTPTIYDFDGSDNRCEWHSYAHSIDDTPDSIEGKCRAKSGYTTTVAVDGTDTTEISTVDNHCFDTCDAPGSVCGTGNTTGTCRTFIEGNYCVPDEKSSLGETYCGHLYSGHHLGCNAYNNQTTFDEAGCNSNPKCDVYQDPRYLEFPASTPEQDKGICVSDGTVTYDLTTGESLGLLMTDDQCNEISDSQGCMNYMGQGCLWEPFNKYCIPKVTTEDDEGLFNSCQMIDGHVPANYDINMIEEEHKNVSEYRDRENKKYPYITSKYLCDICNIRDQDLDTMKQLSTQAVDDVEAANKLKYFMIKKYVDFGDNLPESSRSTSVSMTPQQYCESNLDDEHDLFKACEWNPVDVDVSSKGGVCQSICSKHSPSSETLDSTGEITTMDLKEYKDQCVSDKWFPTSPGTPVEFPRLISGSESDDSYYDDRYCSWDGFECHNSIPCKFAQQTRCEDLGYEWYEGSALDVMNQGDAPLGIPLDLSTSYPIVRKGDGKPVEGDIEGICIYPNAEPGVGFHSQPADYMINPEYIGKQAVIIKYREYGTGWWKDLSCMRKMENLTEDIIRASLNSTESFFLGENVILVPFEIMQGDKCSDVKMAINNALQNYQYYVYNGEWLCWAEDIILSIDRSYDSTIDENSMNSGSDIEKYQKHYGYLYYVKNSENVFNQGTIDVSDTERKRLNAIYDMRGTVNLLPVVGGLAALEIKTFSISTQDGQISMTVETHGGVINETRFQFVEFITPSIFSSTGNDILDNALNLTVLSKYKYVDTTDTVDSMLPENLVQGYGTLYESKLVSKICDTDGVVEQQILKAEGFKGTVTETADAPPSLNPSDELNTEHKCYNILNGYLGIYDTDTPDVNYTIHDERHLKNIMNLFNDNSGPKRYTYTPAELQTWAAYKEYTNFNIFSQPIIYCGKEFRHKIECKDSDGNTKICGGSIESYKYFAYETMGKDDTSINEQLIPDGCKEAPKYQVFRMRYYCRMLRLLSRYFKGTDTEFNSQYFTLRPDVYISSLYLPDATLSDYPTLGAGLNNNDATVNKYREIINHGDIKKAALWSICRNAPPFWGNLSFNRGSLDGVHHHPLYKRGCNFNIIPEGVTSVDDPNHPGNFTATGVAEFNVGLADTTLIKPFCEVSNDPNDQRIYWKRILSYTGGNKREIQVSRNVPKTEYDYIVGLIPTSASGLLQRPSSDDDTDVLFNKIMQLWPIITLSKREYIIRALLDWQRRAYLTPEYDTLDTVDRLDAETNSVAGPDSCGLPGGATKPIQLVSMYNSLKDKKIDELVPTLKEADDANSLETYEKNLFNLKDLNLFTARTGCASGTWNGTDAVAGYVISCGGGNALGNGGSDWGHDDVAGRVQNANHGGAPFNSIAAGWPDQGLWTREGLVLDGSDSNRTGTPSPTGVDRGTVCGNYNVAPGYFYAWHTEEDDSNFTSYYCGGGGGNTSYNNNWPGDELKGCSYGEDNGWPCGTPGGSISDDGIRDNKDYVAKRWNYCCGIGRYYDCRIRTDTNSATGEPLPTTGLFKDYQVETNRYYPKWTSMTSAQQTSFLDSGEHADIKPDSVNNLIAAIYRLTHIPPPSTLVEHLQTQTYPIDSRDFLVPWGQNATDEAQGWAALNTEYEGLSDITMIDHLSYPDPSESDDPTDRVADWPSITQNTERPDSDKLRAWCMSTKESLNSNTFYLDGSIDGNKAEWVDPDNSENQMGILYNFWLNNNPAYENAGFGASFEENTEFFDREKEVNAYKYPMICEPWLLKATTTDSKLAYYTDTIVDWQGVNFNPLEFTGYSYPDKTSLTTDSGVSQAYPWSASVDASDWPPDGSITDSNNVFGDLTSEATSFTQFKNRSIANINKTELVGAGNTKNYLYNMLYPLSITAARPRELKIYVNITPNNDMFNIAEDPDDDSQYDNRGKINIYYFDDMIDGMLGSTVSNSLAQGDANESIMNYYDISDVTNKNAYWLHPGIDDMISRNATVGLSENHKANRYVKYFKTIHDLLDTFITKRTMLGGKLIEYKFDLSSDDQLPENMEYAAIHFRHQSPRDVFFNTTTGMTNELYIDNLEVALGFRPNPFNLLSYPTSYEDEHFPPKDPTTEHIGINFFGNGRRYTGPDTQQKEIEGITYSSELYAEGLAISDGPTSPISIYYDGTLNFYTTDHLNNIENPVPTFYNINMVFPSGNTAEDSVSIDTCKSLIESKLSTCGNYSLWSGSDDDEKARCGNCFETTSSTNLGICPEYSKYIMGTGDSDGGSVGTDNDITRDNTLDSPADSIDAARQAGVCGVLNYNRIKENPWNYISVTHQPPDFGTHLPPVSPYDTDNRTCNNLQNNQDVSGADSLKFTAIQHAGSSTAVDSGITFFKPARSGSSDVFYDQHVDLDQTPFGCMRQDLTLMNKDQINLSCNTNLSTPVERDKHVLINFIINHDTTEALNASHRTKLAIMTEEELINKAVSLGVNLEQINEYTKPKLMTKTRDIYNPNLCEKVDQYCDETTMCPSNGGECGRYEQWNDLNKYYYNISNNNEKQDFITNKQWEFVGCGIDLNYNDNSSGEIICKDKYPGLCEQNIDKCTSQNDAVREAIMLDCPETCQVQYSNLDSFKGEQLGELSICTSRGRCKWSHDMDPSNLLPLCEENTVRELGTVQKCRNYNSPTDGPRAGSCDLREHPGTINSTVCKRQRCESMQGCEYTQPTEPFCRLDSAVDPNIINEVDCPEGGRWVGATSTGGQCILPERDLSMMDMQSTSETFISDCNILGGTVIGGQEESCEYIPDLPYSGEDPCNHIVDLDDLTTDEQARYLYEPTTPIHVDSIMPEILDGDVGTHPHYIKIILDTTLNNNTMVNFGNMTDMNHPGEFYPRDKYIYIDNNSDHIESVCSQYLVGKSKIVQMKNVGPDATEKTEIIIGGPNKSYILPRKLDDPTVIDIGDTATYKACEFRGIYDLEQYYTNNENTDGEDDGRTSSQRKQDACLNNPKGACNYEITAENCVSCSLYRDEFSCFGGDNPNDYSRCGWGSIENMCAVIGDMEECKKMHLDGCEWDPAQEKCSLNKLTNPNGTALIEKVGCVKCDDIKHRNTCNSMKNCFWDRLTNTDGDNIGECRACTSIGDPNGNGVDVSNATWNDIQSTYDGKIEACDDYDLTEGQCQFRNPQTHVTGFNVLSPSYIWDEEKNFLEIIWDSIKGDTSHIDDNNKDCQDENEGCKCSFYRPYPILPDFVMHNLFFILVMAPFIIYFLYAWWKVFVTPCIYEGKEELKKINNRGKIVNAGGSRAATTSAVTEVANLAGEAVSGASDALGEAAIGATDALGEAASGATDALGEAASGATDALGEAASVATQEGGSLIGGGDDMGDETFKEIVEKLKGIFTDEPKERFVNTKKKANQFMTYFKEVGYFNDRGEFSQTSLYTKTEGSIVDVAFRGFLPSNWSNSDPIEIATAQFSNMMPQTDIVDNKVQWGGWLCKVFNQLLDGELIGWQKLRIIPYLFTGFIRPAIFFKIIYLIIAFPFTLLQLFANNLRLCPGTRLGNLFWKATKWLGEKAPEPPFPVNIIVGILALVTFILTVVSHIGIPLAVLGYGVNILKEILEYGVLPNHNYIDPVEGVTIPDPSDPTKTVTNAAKWPAVWYRDEWDDMIKDPISDAVIEQREELLPDAIRGDLDDDNNITDVYSLAYLTITPDSLNWTQHLKNAGKAYNNFINRIGDKFIYRYILLPFLVLSYVLKMNGIVEKYYETDGYFDIQSFATWTLIFAVIMGLLHAIMTPSEAKEDEFDGVESKCPAEPTPTPFSLGDEPINYPQLCFGDSDEEGKYECPYGCYYVGDGSEDPKKCKDNRSVLSLGNILGMNLGLLEPETTMNMPYPDESAGGIVTNDWRVGGEEGHEYKCPPESRFATKWPYDYICSTTAKRCRATDDTVNNSEDADEYCEMLYRANNYNDNSCSRNFTGEDDIRYTEEDVGPRGKIDSIGNGVACQLETPYEGYRTHYNCPFPLPAAENTFFSEQGDTRAPVSLWQWVYDRIQHPERQETCTAMCDDPGNCTNEEQDSIDTCQAVVMDKSRDENRTTCENTAAGALRCVYYPQNVPLQSSIQNQERYLIVNQQYGENLFS